MALNVEKAFVVKMDTLMRIQASCGIAQIRARSTFAPRDSPARPCLNPVAENLEDFTQIVFRLRFRPTTVLKCFSVGARLLLAFWQGQMP